MVLDENVYAHRPLFIVVMLIGVLNKLSRFFLRRERERERERGREGGREGERERERERERESM